MHCVRGLSRMRTWQLQSILAICFAAVTFTWDVSESNIPSRAWETDGWARTFYTLTYEHHMQQKARDKLEPETATSSVCRLSRMLWARAQERLGVAPTADKIQCDVFDRFYGYDHQSGPRGAAFCIQAPPQSIADGTKDVVLRYLPIWKCGNTFYRDNFEHWGYRMPGRDTPGTHPPPSTGSDQGASAGHRSFVGCNDNTAAVTVTAVRDPLDRFVSGYTEVVDRYPAELAEMHRIDTLDGLGRNHYRACRSMKVAADNPPKDEAEWRHQAVAYVHGLLALNDLVFTCAVKHVTSQLGPINSFTRSYRVPIDVVGHLHNPAPFRAGAIAKINALAGAQEKKTGLSFAPPDLHQWKVRHKSTAANFTKGSGARLAMTKLVGLAHSGSSMRNNNDNAMTHTANDESYDDNNDRNSSSSSSSSTSRRRRRGELLDGSAAAAIGAVDVAWAAGADDAIINSLVCAVLLPDYICLSNVVTFEHWSKATKGTAGTRQPGDNDSGGGGDSGGSGGWMRELMVRCDDWWGQAHGIAWSEMVSRTNRSFCPHNLGAGTEYDEWLDVVHSHKYN